MRQSLPLNRESFAAGIFHFHSAKFVISACSSHVLFVTSNYFRSSYPLLVSRKFTPLFARRCFHGYSRFVKLSNERDSMTGDNYRRSLVKFFVTISNLIPIKLDRIVLLKSYVFTISINSRENLFAYRLFLLAKENYIIHLRIIADTCARTKQDFVT